MGGPESLLEAFKQQLWNMSVQRSREQGAALHKPLTILALLSRLESGAQTDNRLRFADAETKFNALWPDFGGRPSTADAALPFFHLRSEPFWSLRGVDANASSPPARSALRSEDVWAELLPQSLFDQLRSSREARIEAAESVLGRWWPTHVAQSLAEKLGLARAHYLCVVDPDNFAVCLETATWGAQQERALKKWRPGDVLMFHLTKGRGLSALGVVTSDVYRDDAPLWQDMSGKAYPWRLKFRLVSRLSTGVSTKGALQPLRRDAPRNWFNGFIQSTHSLSNADAAALLLAFDEARER